MRGSYWRRWWTVLFWIAAWMPGLPGTSFAQSDCARTPAEAVSGAHARGSLSAPVSGGFHVISTRWDPVLRTHWALIASCGHSEWPAVEVPVRGLQVASSDSEQTPPFLRAAPVVRAGDSVQLWSVQGNLRIEVAAIAEQSGAVGQTMRVRLMQRKTLDQQTDKEFLAVVRGPGNVEMQR